MTDDSKLRRSQDRITGRVASGRGEGQRFTQLDWAREQFRDRLGIDPSPGTLNLIVDEAESVEIWNRLKCTSGIRIDNPNDGPSDCNARCYPVSVEGKVDAAIVLPEVPGYAATKVEVIASVGIRSALGVEDGDRLSLEIR
ncbi:MAG: CTP-dependent riboflavin kinase [Deltaproteobacteria bacterium]|jgi:CTP-dependent riboflavin kinase|nr:CTP-dependent riboflavin kinase [Deltaproteobacteria bacterium]